MSSKLYNKYLKCIEETDKQMSKYHSNALNAKKLQGAIAVELLKQEIDTYLETSNKPLKASAVNSYIAGSKYEYDLLIVKNNAVPYMNLLYSPDDVIAILECKAGGLFKVERDTNNITTAINCALELNPKARFGYITMRENVPVNLYHPSGKPTVKHWDLTKEYLTQNIHGLTAVYAVTLHKGKNLCDNGSDEEFNNFLNFLSEA